ncbi:hypothetical protein DFP90_12119 [Aestuariispira insulae]|uniref:Uncharacterized protein n=1 Tax=Aestuariispira insulae TaxID=1461337 RepID=A0A3D9H2H3_9PROT|nr:hypothetical protein DFP90_12119 [Aestuariispira insulae]
MSAGYGCLLSLASEAVVVFFLEFANFIGRYRPAHREVQYCVLRP